MKKINLIYILFLCFAGVILAFKSVMSLFCGAGLAFVAALTLLAIISVMFFKNEEIKNSLLDLFIVSCVLLGLELVTYFAGEIVLGGMGYGILVYQSVISCLGLIFFAYIAIRWVLAQQNKGFNFGTKREKRVKAAKELTNGSLEDKPNKVNEQSLFEKIQTEKQNNAQEKSFDEDSEK